MTAREVISLAATGELKQLAVRTDTEAVVGFINLGLIELYKRFPIATKEQMLILQDNISEYTLETDFMWLVAAYGEVATSANVTTVNQLPINDEDDPLSVNTVAWDKVEVPLSVKGGYISLIYVASPTLVTINTLDEPLPIPAQMLEALLNYIGYRGQGAMDGAINSESNTHYQRFEMSVGKIIKNGMFTPESLNMSNRIHDKGFV